MKTLSAVLAVAMLVGVVDLSATAASARHHHRHRICHAWRYHHHWVRRCHWVW